MLNARIIFLLSIASAAGLAAACGSSNNGDGTGSPDAGGGGQDASPATDATSASDTSSPGDSGGGGDAGKDTGVVITDGGASDASDSAIPGDGAFITAAHPSLPIVLNQGGPVMSAPVVTSVTFSKSTYTNSVTDLDALVSGIGTQPYWAATTSEYGIGVPTVAAAQHLNEAAPATIADAAIKTWLTAKIQSSATGFAGATANSLFVLYYPSTTTITQSATATSCVQFGGYHGSTTAKVGGTTVDVPYAVVPECITPADAGAGAPTTLESTTGAASHEIVEAVTDPFVNSTVAADGPAWVGTTSQASAFDPYAAWAISIAGGPNLLEVGDMCESFGSSFFTPAGFAYQIQRTWSNANVKASKDPCAPYHSGEAAYFLAQPVFDPNFAADEAKSPPQYVPVVNFTPQGQSTLSTQGVKIAVGASATIPLILWSDAPAADWTVAVRDPGVIPPAVSPYLSFALDKTTGHNGDTIMLTIKVLSANATLGGEVFVVTSTDNVLRHSTYGFVGQN